MNFTKEQLNAINKEGGNILVSAGAGSGKTAILSERILRKIKEGGSIDRFLILTFTRAAAFEMDERIRKKLLLFKEEYEKISSSYITTFDSFCLSIVKKYHYKLNLTKDIKITDESIIDANIKEILSDIFNDFYQSGDENFKDLLKTYTTKSDDEIKKYLFLVYKKINLLYEKEKYLKDYPDNFYSDKFIEGVFVLYNDLVQEKVQNILLLKEQIENEDYDFGEKLISFQSLENKNFIELFQYNDIKVPRVPNNSSHELKILKENFSNEYKDLQKLIIYKTKEEFESEYLKNKTHIITLVDILKLLDKKVCEFKDENELYSFLDIAKMAIKIVSENPDAKKFYQEKFDEILIDEYQDTSNLQEELINLISKNNVYMVGDIKQSIYKFRNANPDLFNEKFDLYKNENIGFRIDLNKNFRSNNAVIEKINMIFNLLMTQKYGGANYKLEHNLEFGNKIYDELGLNQKKGLSIYNIKEYTKEKEIFFIAEDILKKISEKTQIYDKNLNNKRCIEFKDCTILIDRSNEFNTYKKVFEYLNIPVAVYKEDKINDDVTVLVLRNIFVLLKKIYTKRFDNEFKYAFYSVGRSYLNCISDDELYKITVKDEFQTTPLYKSLLKISENLLNKSINTILEEIIYEFRVFDSLIKIGDIKGNISLLNFLLNLTKENEIFYDVDEFLLYLDKIISEEISLSFYKNEESVNAVKLMTIHKSKGLEFPYVYYGGIGNKFNTDEVNSRYNFHDEFGLIIPVEKHGLFNSITKKIYKNIYLNDELSEKIRLFYVALTRAREEMIFISSFDDLEACEAVYNNHLFVKNNSFQDFLKFVFSQIRSDIEEVSVIVNPEYKFVKKTNYKERLKNNKGFITTKKTERAYEEYESQTFSKQSADLFSDAIKKNINLGNRLHSILENIDLKKEISHENEYIDSFLKLDILRETINFFQEYEFSYFDGNTEKIGSIDLLLEKEEKIIIIDYKLKNIFDEDYLYQLKGYKAVIEKITTKPVEIYLYSLIKKELRSVTT